MTESGFGLETASTVNIDETLAWPTSLISGLSKVFSQGSIGC